MRAKLNISLLLVFAAAALALVCCAAAMPNLAFGASSETFNLTVGNTLVGEDSNRWQGEGEARCYVYDEADLSYAFYPSTSTLQLNGGTITGYYVYNDGAKDVEVGGVVSVNCVPGEAANTNISNLTIEVAEDTTVLVSQHAPTNVDPSASAFTDSTKQTTVSATICGPGTLSISTVGTLESCSVSGFMFNEVKLSEENPGHIVFDSIKCANSKEGGSCGFTGIEGNGLVSIGEGCKVEFNTVEVTSVGVVEFCGISGKQAVVKDNAQVTLHNLDYSCGGTAGIGYSYAALFHVFGNFTSTGDIRMAPDVDDAVNVSLAKNNGDSHEKIIVAGVAADYQAGDAVVNISGNFVMNNVALSANATVTSQEEGDVFVIGIHNGSKLGATNLTGLNFVFNEYGKSNISIDGQSVVRLSARAVDEARNLKAESSNFDITLPKVDATYLCNRSDVSGMMAYSGSMTLSNSIIDVCYSDINVDAPCSFLGHAGLVAVGSIRIDGISRYTVVCTEAGDMTGMEASSISLADDAMLNIQAPVGKPAISKGLYGANNGAYAHVGEEAEQANSVQLSTEDVNDANIIKLAEGYTPCISYGRDAQSAASATTLQVEQYTENSFFAIANTAYDYHVTFDSVGGSAVETQTVHNLALAQKPADPVKAGYAFEGWYADAACTELYDFDTPVTGDLTLYAKWKADGVVPATDTSATSTPATGDSGAFAVFPVLMLSACAFIGAVYARRRTKLK